MFFVVFETDEEAHHITPPRASTFSLSAITISSGVNL
jgi:hypothetical protein